MNLSIPIYIEEHKVPGSPSPRFTLRPLFIAKPAEVAQQLSGGMSKLARKIREILDQLASAPRQEELIPWTFSPALAENALKFTVQLRRQTIDCRCLVIDFDALDRRLAIIPAIDDLWFEITRGQTLLNRARDVVTDHLRRREKEEAEDFSVSEDLTTYNRAWVTPLEIDIHPHPQIPKPSIEGLLGLFGGGKVSGRAELQKVGRCLDWLYPDDLDRVVLRDAEVDELTRLLAAPDRRPIMLVGPRKVGKTAIIHEAVHRRVTERKTPHVAERNLWLLSPARLIAGMSYVGQWENRLLAILEEARERHHVLYFDDVLGLFQAGISADSELNVASVMRPWIERRDFRLLAEMTPDSFRVLQERDRGFADQFHVLPVREPSEGQTRRVLIHFTRRLESRHDCRFDVEVLPSAMDLLAHHVRDQSMPGKAAGLLAQLATKHHRKDISRETAIAEFQASSGLSISFLDTTQRLERQDVIDALARKIVGQEAALEALADVITIAKARLNDPGRPLGTFLFLGPTGVGKTQCAKAAAGYLYGDEARLLRFDMNEYVEGGSVLRLIGTFAQSEGLLTSAVRRQPYCIVLLDEIEKAHPAVFDLLLQVLGEGRLTDSLGRTSDFTNAIIIMTSNLGTRAAASQFGLRPAESARDEVFLDAARAFFRPEFFNRIDRIVPFNELTRQHVSAIADHLITALFAREGLVHRRCVLQVEPAAMERIIEQGYHPQLGARALRRAVEKQLTQPIAQRLSGLKPDAPTLITIYPGAGDAVVPHIQALVSAKPNNALLAIDDADVDPILARVEEYLDALETRLSASEAAANRSVSADALSAAHFKYFAIREQIQRVDRLIQSIDQELSRPPRSRNLMRAPRPIKRIRRTAPEDNAMLSDLLTTPELSARLAELAGRSLPMGDGPGDRTAEVLQECAMLDAMAGPAENRVLIELRRMGGNHHVITELLRQTYTNLFARQHGFTATQLKSTDPCSEFLLLDMPGIFAMVRPESGTHLFFPPHENLVPIQVIATALDESEDAAQAAEQRIAMRNDWRAAVATSQSTPDSAPYPAGPVIRLYDPHTATIDLRTGLLCEKQTSPEEIRRMVLANIPLPWHGHPARVE